MEAYSPIGLILIVVNALATYQGFRDHRFFERYMFEVDGILVRKEWDRLLTSGFLHVNWLHFLFNMYALYSFSASLELLLTPVEYLALYFGSLLGGNLLALYMHRHHGDYSAVGASGAVSGIVFAAIALFPGIEVGFIFLPVGIPGWLFGLLYVLFSIYGMKSQRDNIGHDAHLGGGLVGLLIAVALQPFSLKYNYVPILAILLPAAALLWLLVNRPHWMLLPDFKFGGKNRNFTPDDQYNARRKAELRELDQLLEKINRKGMKSLTEREKERLKELGKR